MSLRPNFLFNCAAHTPPGKWRRHVAFVDLTTPPEGGPMLRFGAELCKIVDEVAQQVWASTVGGATSRQN
jgi:hypothetical protein